MVIYDNCEWTPIYDFIMIELIENIFKSSVTKSGLVLPSGMSDRNESAGQVGEVELRIRLARVVSAGPDCKFLKVGDYIYVDRASSRPIPLMENRYRVMPERNIILMGRELKTEE